MQLVNFIPSASPRSLREDKRSGSSRLEGTSLRAIWGRGLEVDRYSIAAFCILGRWIGGFGNA